MHNDIFSLPGFPTEIKRFPRELSSVDVQDLLNDRQYNYHIFRNSNSCAKHQALKIVMIFLGNMFQLSLRWIRLFMEFSLFWFWVFWYRYLLQNISNHAPAPYQVLQGQMSWEMEAWSIWVKFEYINRKKGVPDNFCSSHDLSCCVKEIEIFRLQNIPIYFKDDIPISCKINRFENHR